MRTFCFMMCLSVSAVFAGEDEPLHYSFRYHTSYGSHQTLHALTFSLDDVSTAALAKLSAANTSHQIGFYSAALRRGGVGSPPDATAAMVRATILISLRSSLVIWLRPCTVSSRMRARSSRDRC